MTRVLSALLLAALVLGVVFLLPPIATLVLAIVAAALAFDEYADLAAALGATIPRMLCTATVTVACVGAGSDAVPLDMVLLLSFVILCTYVVFRVEPGPTALLQASAAILPIVYIGLPLGSLAAVRLIGGRDATALLIATMIVSDSLQYYTGRLFGRRPLAPAISPKKTIEGAIGGVLFGTVFMTAVGARVLPFSGYGPLIVLGLLVVAFGICGDLFESRLKRTAGLKDSSSLIPGHGGVLDRIDALLFAVAPFYLYIRNVT